MIWIFIMKFSLKVEGKIQFSTRVPQETEVEVLDWAENYCLITKEEYSLVRYAKEIKIAEVDESDFVEL